MVRNNWLICTEVNSVQCVIVSVSFPQWLAKTFLCQEFKGLLTWTKWPPSKTSVCQSNPRILVLKKKENKKRKGKERKFVMKKKMKEGKSVALGEGHFWIRTQIIKKKQNEKKSKMIRGVKNKIKLFTWF